MLYGRSAGFAPGPAPVGPWRPVRLRRRLPAGIESLAVLPRLSGDDGVVLVRARCRGAVELAEIQVAGIREPMLALPDGSLQAELLVPGAERWWPHTHGAPVLHELTVLVDGEPVERRRIGFRDLSWAADIREDGLELEVNGQAIFVRGAVWTPADLVSMAPSEAVLRSLLERVRDAGMNMLRVVGNGAYESPSFHDLCDELGILVWQDLMFANLDYPIVDADFRAVVEREAREVIAGLAGRPSLAVVCGNSEVEQQPAMMGLDPALGRDQLWEQDLAQIVAESGADCAYVPSTPTGGDLPFHPDRGVSHYFGVSGYMRAPEDVRRAGVRFASECLAFANVPDEVGVPVHHPAWKAGVQREGGTGWDLGAGWDFDDVRDYYTALLFEVDPMQLRRSQHSRYLELSRAASGEVMAELMGEWRRPGSRCSGALVLWLKDMLPGAGLGVLDHRGAPKVAYHHLRRALRPVAVWTTDEGVAGVAIHVANDRAEPLAATLRVALYKDLQNCVGEASEVIELGPHSSARRTVEGILGRFVDAAWAYRFGPPAQDAIVVSLESLTSPPALLSQSTRFPAGRPTTPESTARIGLQAFAEVLSDGSVALRIGSVRLAYGVRVHVPGFEADDDAFCLEPGHDRVLSLRRAEAAAEYAGGTLSAVNLDGVVKIGAA